MTASSESARARRATPEQPRKSRWQHAIRPGLALAAALALSACVSGADQVQPIESFLATNAVPMRWDHRSEAANWTLEAYQAVADNDAALADLVPKDIAQWCPGYERASVSERRAFWVGLMSAVAKHESTWNPAASGGGGRYIGLMQISPRTAAQHGCEAKTAGALKDGGENLSCAVEIFSGAVAKDGLVAGNGRSGIGRDWGPFRKSDKRAEMAAWTAKQPYCQG